MVICPSCGAENEPEAAFCEECGAQLAAASASSDDAPTERMGPLVEGDQINGRYTVSGLLDSGRIHRYSVEPESFILEGPVDDESFLKKQAKCLGDVQSELIWRPEEDFEWEDRHYLSGALWGPSLRQVVADLGPRPWEEVQEIGVQLCQAVGDIHEAHLLHLTLSPNRVFIRQDQGLRLDPFGRLSPKGTVQDHFEIIAGFSPPECYGMQGGKVGNESDIFGIGAILHFLLTGTQTDLEARENFFNFARPMGEAPAHFVDAVMRAVNKAPEKRYATTEELAQALAEEPPEVEPEVEVPTETMATPSNNGRGGPVTDYHVAMLSDIGCVRSINQDACLELRFASVERSCPHDAHLVVVIDGMGGEAEGDKAASLALRAIAQEVVGMSLALRNERHTAPLLPPDRVSKNKHILKRALEVANRTIFEYAQLKPSIRSGMGCTVTAALLDGETAVFGHVGDTRAYHFREQLEKITSDHSLVGRLVEMGQMTPEQARNSPQRSIIYRAMGTNPEVEVDLYERNLCPGDVLMMSSDGVWEYFEHSELQDLFASGAEPEELCRRLVEICLSRGADDNATVAVVKAIS